MEAEVQESQLSVVILEAYTQITTWELIPSRYETGQKSTNRLIVYLL